MNLSEDPPPQKSLRHILRSASIASGRISLDRHVSITSSRVRWCVCIRLNDVRTKFRDNPINCTGVRCETTKEPNRTAPFPLLSMHGKRICTSIDCKLPPPVCSSRLTGQFHFLPILSHAVITADCTRHLSAELCNCVF